MNLQLRDSHLIVILTARKISGRGRGTKIRNLAVYLCCAFQVHTFANAFDSSAATSVRSAYKLRAGSVRPGSQHRRAKLDMPLLCQLAFCPALVLF